MVVAVSHSAELYGAERVFAKVVTGLNRDLRGQIQAILPCTGVLEAVLREAKVHTEVMPFTAVTQAIHSPRDLWRCISELRHLVSRLGKADVVYLSTNRLALVSLALRLRGAKVIWHVHESLPQRGMERLMVRIAIRLFRGVCIVPSNHLARLYGWQRCTVLPNILPPVEEGGAHTAPIIDTVVVLGSLHRSKHVDTVLVATNMASMALQKRLKVLIIGDGPERLTLESLVARLRYIDVQFMGRVEHPWPIIQAGATLVAAGTDEGFGLGIIEAWQRGVIVVAANDGAHPELIKHGTNGLLFAPSDPSDLASQLQRIHRAPLDWTIRIRSEAALSANEYSSDGADTLRNVVIKLTYTDA